MILSLAVALLLQGSQDALVAASGEYKLEFENAFARIVRVRYAKPGERSPMHDHSALPVVHIALQDASNRHTFESGRTVVMNRRAGSVLYAPAARERHSVENIGTHGSENVRVELKTVPATEPVPISATLAADCHLELENEQVRVVRVAYPGGGAGLQCASESRMGVAVFLGEFEGTLAAADRSAIPEHRAAGEAVWSSHVLTDRRTQSRSAPAEVLLVELKGFPKN